METVNCTSYRVISRSMCFKCALNGNKDSPPPLRKRATLSFNCNTDIYESTVHFNYLCTIDLLIAGCWARVNSNPCQQQREKLP